MGILDFIFGKNTIVKDSFFGEMLFLEFKKNPIDNYFECRRHFEPINNEIEIGIEGEESGSTELQRAFFRKIESSYGKIIASAKPLIEDEFQNWKKDFMISDFRNEFKAVYLHLPRCTERPIIWKISFETEHDLNHIFIITMNDLKAIEISIDG